jgi:uncharacterized protein (TIGR02217 family)
MAILPSFHDVLFPLAVSFGATGGPEMRNEIVRLTSGAEKRNARFSGSRRRYDAGTGLNSLDDLHEVLAFFEARRGSLHGFRFRDPFDMKSCRPEAVPGPLDQPIGTGDGTTAAFALVKHYGVPPDTVTRRITKPVAGSVRVAVDGENRSEGVDFTVDCALGVVQFAAGAIPPPGAAVSAGFSFDVPVRFDTEHLSACLTGFRAGRIPAIPLIEVME